MTTTTITVDIDDERLDRCPDTRLAMLWHVAQHNLAPITDYRAGELVERIGREIIRRWLRHTPPALWNHQGRSYYWWELYKFARYEPPAGAQAGSPQWHDGTWVAKDPGETQ